MADRTYISLSIRNRIEIPESLVPEDNRFSEEFVEHFLNRFTKKGDLVLDPFAGLGTTMFVAEEMGRIPYGIEFDKHKSEFIKSKIKNKEGMINGDSRKFETYDFPKFDFCITSPPYAEYHDERNPFTDYSQPGKGYSDYLNTLKGIYMKIKQKMKPGAFIIVEASNLKRGRIITPLAWDVGKTLSEVFRFEGETVVCWKEGYDYGYDHSYALIFCNQEKEIY